MQRVRALVAAQGKVTRKGLASIIGASNILDVVGNDREELVKEALELQPDLIVYELTPCEESEYNFLRQLRKKFLWTKIVVFASFESRQGCIKSYMGDMDGYIQGPLLPGYLIKALELICFSGHFLYLGHANILGDDVLDVDVLVPEQ